jgi:hypothetical protein
LDFTSAYPSINIPLLKMNVLKEREAACALALPLPLGEEKGEGGLFYILVLYPTVSRWSLVRNHESQFIKPK